MLDEDPIGLSGGFANPALYSQDVQLLRDASILVQTMQCPSKSHRIMSPTCTHMLVTGNRPKKKIVGPSEKQVSEEMRSEDQGPEELLRIPRSDKEDRLASILLSAAHIETSSAATIPTRIALARHDNIQQSKC